MDIQGKRLVLVEWEDSAGVSASWEEIRGDIKAEPLTCYSAGWLVAESDRAIVIVPHLHEPDETRNIAFHGCGDMTIPTSAILRIVDLTPTQGAAAAE